MGAEAGVETVPVRQQSDGPMLAHIICGICCPEDEVEMGTPAICGEKVLGIKPRPPYTRCDKCVKGKFAHHLAHRIGGR